MMGGNFITHSIILLPWLLRYIIVVWMMMGDENMMVGTAATEVYNSDWYVAGG